MLYKVTPMMVPASGKEKKAGEGQPRKRRKSAVYDGDGHEVLISLMCLKCKTIKPLAQFGLRKMADGAIRNQPWCRTCRSGTGVKKDKAAEAKAPEAEVQAPAAEAEVQAAEAAEAQAEVQAEVHGADAEDTSPGAPAVDTAPGADIQG